ncbi:hypothetical protein AB4142_30235, partial [Variovorax sp. 2RAF20]
MSIAVYTVTPNRFARRIATCGKVSGVIFACHRGRRRISHGTQRMRNTHYNLSEEKAMQSVGDYLLLRLQ